MTHLSSYGHDAISRLIDDDEALVKLANEARVGLSSSPAQSDFRVFAILVVEKSDRSLCFVPGANCEQGYIGGAICAERAALVALRFLASPIIHKVIVVSDSENPLSPGVLCREFLMSHADSDVPILMGNGKGDKIAKCALQEIWPYPYIYRLINRHQLLQFASYFSSKMQSVEDAFGLDSTYSRIYLEAQRVNDRDQEDVIHPLRLSAAVLFDDGGIETAWQLKGLEYGCTLDPINQLIHAMEQRRYLCVACTPTGATHHHVPAGHAEAAANSESSMGCNDKLQEGIPMVDSLNSGTVSTSAAASTAAASIKANVHQASVASKPLALVLVDQFGVTHAPFAAARATLCEHGYGYIQIAVHSSDGKLESCSVAELVPHPPDCPLLSHDDFHIISHEDLHLEHA